MAMRGQDWICETCGNSNYADRVVCNRRTCGLARPGDDYGYDKFGGKGDYGKGDYGKGKGGKDFGKGGKKGGKGGSDWICPACGNSNYADRMYCNMRSCGAPKPEGGRPGPYDKGGDKGWGKGGDKGWGKGGDDWGYGKGGDKGWGKGGGKDKGKGGKKGGKGDGWWCPAPCGNFNFADKLVCNLRQCQLPRPEGAGSGGKQYFRKRAGMWICPHNDCGNVNFADRQECNKNVCKWERDGTEELVLEDDP